MVHSWRAGLLERVSQILIGRFCAIRIKRLRDSNRFMKHALVTTRIFAKGPSVL